MKKTEAITYLDGHARPCQETAALLVSTRSQNQEPDNEQETVRAYRPALGVLAEGDAAARQASSLGTGAYEGDKQEIGGYAFYCGPMGRWEYETATCKIEVAPTADRADVETWLATFYPLEKKIIDRGISGPKLTFELGGKQRFKETAAAEAFSSQRLVRFPTTSDGCHLLAVCIERGSVNTADAVSLEGIILHEIGHTLETLLRGPRDFLRTAMEGKMLDAVEALDQISPHYLRKEFPKIVALLKKAALTETIKFRGETWDSEEMRNTLVEETSHEIFAELVRYFYLEPALTGNIPAPQKTKWRAFDDLSEILTREASYNLRKEKGGCPLFPEKRRVRRILPLEALQDFVSP